MIYNIKDTELLIMLLGMAAYSFIWGILIGVVIMRKMHKL